MFQIIPCYWKSKLNELLLIPAFPHIAGHLCLS